MNPYELNENLIRNMRGYVPAEVSLASVLIEILGLSKEAAYRRLRGDVPFTLSEAVLIAGRLGISVDKLVGVPENQSTMLRLNRIKSENPMESYAGLLDNYIQILAMATESASARSGSTFCRVPHLYMEGEHLTKFLLFKWMYQQKNTSFASRYEDLVVPATLMNKLKECIAYTRLFNCTCQLWDREMFSYFVRDVQYFAGRNLISEETVKKLKEEILCLLEELENMAKMGRYKSGHEVQIYLPDVHIETNCSYIETPAYHLGIFYLFDTDFLSTEEDSLFQQVKDRIHSLKRFSVLISQSGHTERLQFFKKQRELVAGW